MQIISLSEAEKTVAALKQDFAGVSEMTPTEQAFLTAVIQKFKPKKAVEIGIAAGASSVLLLNALSTLPDKKLISVDYSTEYYRDKNKKSGFIVDQYPELKENWTLHTGGLVSEHVEKIGGDIDFCFIDTVHAVPGEIIDFLAIFPYLKEDAVVVLHDTNLHTWAGGHGNAYVNNILISALSGEKLVPEKHDDFFYHHLLQYNIINHFPNIAGVILDKNQKDRIWDIFNLLTLKWTYAVPLEDLMSFGRLVQRHYDPRYAEYFNRIIGYQASAE